MATVGSSTTGVVTSVGVLMGAVVVGFTAVTIVVGMMVGASTDMLGWATTTGEELAATDTDVEVELVVVGLEWCWEW
jgi:hypothetical protein